MDFTYLDRIILSLSESFPQKQSKKKKLAYWAVKRKHKPLEREQRDDREEAFTYKFVYGFQPSFAFSIVTSLYRVRVTGLYYK